MSRPKILLHLGLPKTATSSLQHNVFQRLHEERRINFLGKCLNYNYKTGSVEIFNYTGKFIRDAAEGAATIEESRNQLSRVLAPNSLNVFSDEGLMVAYPGKENRPLSEKFENLAKIFEGYDVKVIVTLRDPVDYLYSLYVQLYPDFCSKVKELNTVQKYVNNLTTNPNSVLFESFFLNQWLPVLKNKFEVTVFQYDQLASKDLPTYQGWAELLNLSTDEFSEYFNSQKLNVKLKSGKEVRQVRDLRRLEEKIKNLVPKNQSIFNTSRWLYNASRLNILFKYRFPSRITHEYPEGEQYERLQDLLY